MTIREIQAKRSAVATEMRSIHAGAADGALSSEAQVRWTALSDQAESLAAQEQRAAMLDTLDRAATGQPLDAAFDRERDRVSLGDAIRAGLGATDHGAGRAREMSAEMARRSGRSPEGILWSMGHEKRVSTAAGSAANLIATNLQAASFIERLYAATRVKQLGATVLSGLQGNVDIPRLAGSTTAYWIADNAAVTASDATFDKVSLRPKTVGVLSEVSRLTLLQSTPSIDSLIESDMARVLALALDAAAISGPGTGNQPTGILNTAGIGNVAMGATGGALTYAAVVDLMGEIQDDSADAGALAFLSNPKVRRAAAKLTTTYNEPLTEEVVWQSMPRQFTTAVPSNLTKSTATGLSALIYGNWSDLIMGMWSELDILVNPYESTAYPKGNVQIRAMATMDIAVRHPESFAAIKDIVA